MPEHKVEKTYYFMAEGVLNEERLDEVRRGARIYYNRENPTAPSQVEIISTGTLGDVTTPLSEDDRTLKMKKPYLPTVEGIVKITEGKKHQVKRMVRYAGARVIYLKRLTMATLSLDENLEKGSYRHLTFEELSTICDSAGYTLPKE